MLQRNKMNSLFTLIFTVFLTIILISLRRSHLTTHAQIKDGILWMKDDFSDHMIYALSGEWDYFSEACTNNSFSASQSNMSDNTPQTQPSTYHTGDSYRCGTYHARIILPHAGQYALYISSLPCSYKLYIDQSNTKNNNKHTSDILDITSWNKQLVFFYTNQTAIDITFYINDKSQYIDGNFNTIYLGSVNAINHYQTLSIITNCLYAGLFITMFYFNILMTRSKECARISLCLAGFCICALLFELITDGPIILYFFSNISADTLIRLEYITLIMQGTFFIAYLYNLFGRKSFTGALKITLLFDITLVILIAVLPDYSVLTYNLVLLPLGIMHTLYILLALLSAYKQKLYARHLILLSVLARFLSTRSNPNHFNLLMNHFVFKNNTMFVFEALAFLLLQSLLFSNHLETMIKTSKQAPDLEIAYLQAQISPHFFFNVLNNVYYLIDTDLSSAKLLLVQFNKYLRVKYKFDFRKNVFYNLSEELDLVQAYIDIERIRLHDQIQLQTNIDEELNNLQIPPLLLQPLVENSIKHGFDSQLLTITISIYQKQKEVCFSISDDGKGMGINFINELGSRSHDKPGIGIRNINYRLKKCYNRHLEIESALGKGTTIRFTIPKGGLK